MRLVLDWGGIKGLAAEDLYIAMTRSNNIRRVDDRSCSTVIV